MKSKLLIILLLLCNSSLYAEGYADGKQLKGWGSSSGYKKGLHDGYIGGVVDAGNDILFCTPAGVTVGQYLAVVEKYYNSHPELWAEDASDIVIEALKAVFPCDN